MNKYSKINKQQSFAGLAVAVALTIGIENAHAVLLNTNFVTATTPTVVVQPGAVVGNLQSIYGPSAGGATFFGTLETVVVQRSGAAVIDGQAFVANGLDFWVQVRMDFVLPPPVSDPLSDNSRLSYSPFAPLAPGFLSAEFLAVPVVPAGVVGFSGLLNGTQTPFTVQSNLGGTISWDWTSIGADNSMNAANPSSRWLVLHTNDTVFGTITAGILDGGTANAQTFAPVPEATTGLFGVALTSMVGLVRRRRTPSGS